MTESTALTHAKEQLEKYQKEVEMIEKLKGFIKVPIMQINLFDEVWLRVTDMGMNEAISFMKSIKAKVWKLKAHKSTYNNSESFELFTHITYKGDKLKVTVPINDIKEKHMEFKRTGSTHRSKAVGITVLKTPPQFNYYTVCHGLFTVIYY